MLKPNRESRGAGVRSLLCAAVLALGAVPATAEIMASYETGGRDIFSLRVPDNWVVSAGGFEARQAPEEVTRVPRVLGLRPEADRRVWVGFVSPDGVSTTAQAEAYIRSLDLRLVEDPRLGPPRQTTIGGRSTRTYTGTGSRDGRPVSFTIALIDMPGPRMVIGLIVGEEGARGLYRDEINALVRSFRPM
ncbi:hypothetical protein PSA7680_01816 [Pseudoruegeria aquimaris]|uniref:Uncharacterized protein n=1 Tax=Pseudoruegeria aquimaris TaxID=393663 RepID=A0A1Y5SDJ4_9RHOB|nr:hypothetical protein [Pseudoruegeria aquimaris]SLN37558.1 hypothetical protein PSA7680_01816 [Pseudoruegeria aquimaris]